jgi:hypothetical protein
VTGTEALGHAVGLMMRKTCEWRRRQQGCDCTVSILGIPSGALSRAGAGSLP